MKSYRKFVAEYHDSVKIKDIEALKIKTEEAIKLIEG
jgi:hypothetical protein